MANKPLCRLAALLLTLCLLLSLLPLDALAAEAQASAETQAEEAAPTEEELMAASYPALPDYNSQLRHQVCTALSDQALDYYSGSWSPETLFALEGASANYDSYAVTQDNPLYTALQSLMASTQSFSPKYSGTAAGSLAYYWARSDAVQGLDTYVMFYSDLAPEGYTMNREHVWPKSRASYYQSNGGADLHHLRPSVQNLNAAKSNHMFGNIVGVYPSYNSGSLGDTVCYWTYTAGDLFECKDDVKGDVARILLYVYVRWGQPNLYTDVSSSYLPAFDSDDSQNTGTRVVESLETLLAWCQSDPVDTWEMRRNDLVQQVQGNRNVFIDYPELAWRLFGEAVPAGMQTPSGGTQPCSHQWALSTRTEPSCTEAGTELYLCQLCGQTRTESLEALGHAWEERLVEPSCTEGGYTLHVCSRCGEHWEDSPTQALGHAWDDGTLTQIPSPTQAGLRVYTCTRCGLSREEVLDPVPGFADVQDESAWYYASIYWAAGREPQITKGVSQSSFEPEGVCNRAQVVTFLWRAAGSPAPASAETNPFADVEAGSWYADAVLWAVQNGITQGTGAGSFSPFAPCTRAQIVTLLWRFQGSPQAEGSADSFADVASDCWYGEAVSWAVREGVTQGMGQNRFEPLGLCTRAQTVTFLWRLLA